MLLGMNSFAIPKASSETLPELAEFLEPLATVFRRRQSSQSLERYVTGLLTDLGRKNCQTIASAVAGTSTERLQHLLTDAAWDPLELDAARVRRLSARSSKGGILILDDTSLPKKGNSSVGVAPQYCGTLGKIANCQVLVSAHYMVDESSSSAPLHWPLAGRLYLPEERWAKDFERRKRAHVPEELGFATKPQLALDLLDRAREWEVPFELVLADSGYGKNPAFLEGLEERNLPYVCGVEGAFGVRLADEVEACGSAAPPAYRGRGRPPKVRPAPLYTAEDVIGSLPEEAWQAISWREGTKGDLSKRMAALRVHRGIGSQERYSHSHKHVSTGPEGWLIAERPLLGEKGETKYYFSTLPVDLSIQRLGALAHSRWVIEQFYEDAKGECGLGDYQGRRWDGVHRHLALVMLAYSFLAVHSSIDGEDSQGEQIFFPLHKAHYAAGHP